MRGHATDKDGWKTIWLGASGIAFFGGLVFLMFAGATVQPFDAIGLDKSSTDNKSDVGCRTNESLRMILRPMGRWMLVAT